MRGIAIPYAACDNSFRIKDLASINRYRITQIYHNLDLELKSNFFQEYLNKDSFDQDLINKQPLIDNLIMKYLNEEISKEKIKYSSNTTEKKQTVSDKNIKFNKTIIALIKSITIFNLQEMIFLHLDYSIILDRYLLFCFHR